MSMKVTRDNIPEVLELLRKELKYSCQSDVAEATRLSCSTLHYLKNGKTKQPLLRTFLALCEYYGYEVDMTVPVNYLKVVGGK